MRLLLLSIISLPLSAGAQPAAAAASSPKAEVTSMGAATEAAKLAPAALPLRARLDKDAIRAALSAVPAESTPSSRRDEADTLSATPRQSFAKEFAKARLPDCLHSEGLKNQPTFFLTGFAALPFIAVAKLRGVCR